MDPFSPACELADALRRGEISSANLLDAYLERIANLDATVNSVVTLDAGRARQDAARADDELRAGHVRGPLHGLPITIKDALETAGLRSTAGAPALAQHVPKRDAVAVERLRAAGAIVFGKTNLASWSADLQSFNPLFGTTNNPWNPALTAGGSSGGAAAAVACGFTAFDIGTDIGGSIRMPAHMCGVYGLRPSYGLVPPDGYLAGRRPLHTALDLNVVGPIARSARDLRLVLDVLAGPSSPDGRAWRLQLPDDTRPLRELRFGVWLDDPVCPIASAYRAELERLVSALVGAGARAVPTVPDTPFDALTATCLELNGAAKGLNADDAPAGTSTEISHRRWLELDDQRHMASRIWDDWFDDADVLLVPVLPVAAFPHDRNGPSMQRIVEVDSVPRTHGELLRWPALVTALGVPVCVAPIGLLDDGRPVGVQIVARRLHDRTAINFAEQLDALTGGFRPPPGF